MIKIHAAPNSGDVHNLANVLESRGITCQIRGEDQRMGLGELPPHECWPELWVDPAHADEARAIIAAADVPQQLGWTCPHCGEVLEGQFELCWNCGTYRTQ